MYRVIISNFRFSLLVNVFDCARLHFYTVLGLALASRTYKGWGRWSIEQKCLWLYCDAWSMHNVQFPKISILPSQKGLEFPGGVGGSIRNVWSLIGISRGVGGGGLRKKSLLWGRYGYFLELHNPLRKFMEHMHKIMQLHKFTGYSSKAKFW